MASKYAAAFQSPSGAGDARPTASSIIEDEGLCGSWGDKVVLITGCSSGIGVGARERIWYNNSQNHMPAHAESAVVVQRRLELCTPQVLKSMQLSETLEEEKLSWLIFRPTQLGMARLNYLCLSCCNSSLTHLNQ